MSTYGPERNIFIFLGVLCGVFFLLFLLWVCWACRSMSRYSSETTDATSSGTPPKTVADETRKRILEQTKNLECRKLRNTMDPDPEPRDEACIICLETFKEGATSSVLGQLTVCGHYFHFDCLWSWLVHNPSCPVCRKHVTISEYNIKALTYDAVFGKSPDSPPSSGAIIYVPETGTESYAVPKAAGKSETENGDSRTGSRGGRLWSGILTTRDLWRRRLRRLFWESVAIVQDNGRPYRPTAEPDDVAVTGNTSSHGETIFDWPMTPPSGYTTASLPWIA